MRSVYDVIVIGGGAAGLSAALTLARARRSVLVLDAGEPRNAPAAGVHNLLGREGIPPGELLEAGRAEVRGYGAQIRAARVVAAEPDGHGFRVELADGEILQARRLLVATGLIDELPEIPGLRERWGLDVLHCPYCHGWEVRDRTICVLGTGSHAAFQASLFRQLSQDVTLLLHDGPPPTAEEAAGLAARGVAIVEGEAAALEPEGVRLRSGELIACEAVTVTPRFVARLDGLEGLGLRTKDHPMGVHVDADPAGLTNVPGVWAAGNVADLGATGSGAIDAGVRVAAQVNVDLIAADTRLAAAAV